VSDPYKVTYTFHVEYENVDIPDEPKNSHTTLKFDGTDVSLDVVVGQVETFLKSAGYYFDHLDIVKDSFSYIIK
jgi:hypothetical protein